ncbi:hypothetical protein HDA32_002450 [Spinactinospora alkalitolerans]|uniref:DUF1365 domain-containing protein n=1 Tax=Spinactinospora alkalitolerans TaxID=687207 RepID=A0A852TZX5_9ACTN|nr:DUF1365 domain-containing protein [Spinactinospora alkalitolerans]NYE47330.1 hypothetical protein [Spinactinospora alkalitolerans]
MRPRRTSWPSAALYEARIRHVRSTPIRNAFDYGGYYWLIDVDDPPRLPRPLRWLAGFDAADHRGDPARGLRGQVEDHLRAHGVDPVGGRVLMLAHARVLGHVFNPLTVYWCHAADGSLACVIAEVHNTYGERHRYLLRTDARGRADTAKEFYVSPFHPVDGHYRLSLPEPGADLALTITLHRPGAAPFVASVRGRRRPARLGPLLRLALRYPMTPLVGAARIRIQGIRLFLRGLPVVPRPPSADGRQGKDTPSVQQARNPA